MATQIAVGDWVNKGLYRYTVSGLASADQSNAMEVGNFTEKTVQVEGTFQSAVLTVQGQLATDAAWATLLTPTGGNLEFTAAGIKRVQEQNNVLRIRFVNTTTVSTASDADNTNLKAYLMLRSDRAR